MEFHPEGAYVQKMLLVIQEEKSALVLSLRVRERGKGLGCENTEDKLLSCGSFKCRDYPFHLASQYIKQLLIFPHTLK